MAPPLPEAGPETTIGVIAAIAAFLTISILLGFFMRKKAKSFEEWLVGRRDIGPLVTGFALVASYLSGWAIFGNAGLSYAYGWSGSWLIGTTCVAGMALCLVIGYRMRRYVALGARTVPEMLRVRFESKAVQALAGLAMIVLLIVYAVGQCKAMATVWTITTNTSFYGSLIATAILVLVYLAVSGYTGTQWASCFQGILLTIVGWTLGITALIWAGGLGEISGAIQTEMFTGTQPPFTETPIPLKDYTLPLTSPKGLAFPGVDYIGVIASIFMFLFMATGFPHNIARFLGTRKITKREYWMMLLILVVGGLTPLWVGVVGFAARAVWGNTLLAGKYEPMYGDSAATLVSISAGGIPLASLFVASVFAASVATLAGMVMIMATNITRDLVHNAYPKMSQKKLLWSTRLTLVPFIAMPLWLTFIETPPILSEFMSSSAVAQAGIFFSVVGVSMYWRRATKWGASVTILYGLIVFLFHPKICGGLVGLYHWGYWALLLMFGSALIYFLTSLSTKPLSEEELEKLFPKRKG